MTPEQRMIFADAESPVFMQGAFEIAEASMADLGRVERAFRGDGSGAGHHGRCPCLFSGMERFFRPGYRAHLLAEWLPALEGVVAKLEQGGARVADIGCGHGASVILMAEAFPLARFTGFDSHAASIACARWRRTEPSWWWSRAPATAWSRTSTRWAGSTSPARP